MRQAGFSLIELITVVAITAIVSLVSVNVLVTSQLRSTRANIISQVRREGDFAMQEITFLLRNAKYITANQFQQVCQDDMNAIRVVDQNGGTVELYLDVDRIASNSGDTVSEDPASYFTSPAVMVTGLRFSCRQEPSERGAFVEVEYTVESGSEEELSTESYYAQEYAGNVYVRSYQ